MSKKHQQDERISVLDNNKVYDNNNRMKKNYSNSEFFKVVKNAEERVDRKKKWSSTQTLCLWSVFIALCGVLLLFIVAIVEGRGFAKSVDIKPELFSISTNGQALKIDASFRVGNDLPFIVEVGSGAFDLSYALVSDGKTPEYNLIGHSHVRAISSVSRNTNRLAHLNTEISETVSQEQISEIEQSLWGRQLRFRVKGTIPVFAKILFVKNSLHQAH
jgi:hypothetical protein